MHEFSQHNKLRHPLVSILITLAIFFVGFQFIGPLIGSLIAFPFFPGDEQEFLKAFKDPLSHPEFKISLLLIQGFGALIGLIILPYYLLRMQNRALGDLFTQPYLQPVVILPILVIVFMGVNSVFIKWNQEAELPFGMEDWAKPMEERLAEATVYLTQYESIAQVILAFIVIAILPALGEEILFRGMVQNDFYRATKNIHVSIWMSAFIFSAIHFQFYGFVPRMFLGALFGYLYFWSGNLWMPVFAHFVNNGFTLITLYLFRKGTITLDIEKAEPTVYQVIFSVVFSAILLYAYKSFYDRKPKPDIPE